MVISRFRGEYYFLSNFYPSPIDWAQRVWPTLEHAFQAEKTWLLTVQERIRMAATPGEAKRLGRTVELRADWEHRKCGLMTELIYCKFQQHSDLRAKLVATHPHILEEGNTWGDTYWGKCRGKGLNKLGIILMSVRALFLFQQGYHDE